MKYRISTNLFDWNVRFYHDALVVIFMDVVVAERSPRHEAGAHIASLRMPSDDEQVPLGVSETGTHIVSTFTYPKHTTLLCDVCGALESYFTT